MDRQAPFFFTSLIRFVLTCALMVWALDYIYHTDPFIKWGSIALVIVMAISMIRASFRLLGSSLHAAYQQELYKDSQTPSNRFGSARFAHKSDPFIRKMSNTKGLFLGVLNDVILFFDPFAPGMGHMLTYAPSRTGKTTSVVIPALLHWSSGSIFVTDVKGELAAITAAARKRMGHKVILFNPFNVLGLGGMKFNPLSILLNDIRKNQGRNLHDLVLLFGLLLIPHKEEKNTFFRNGGRRFLVSLLLYLAVFDKKDCHLPGLRDLVWASRTKQLEAAEIMQCTDAYGGLIKKYGTHLQELLDPSYIKTFGGMRDYAIDTTQIYDSHTDFGKCLMKNEFDIDEVLDERTTLFSIIPEEKLDSHGTTNGMLSAIFFERISAKEKPTKFLMIMEEMGNLGLIPNFQKALTLLPGKGLRLWVIAQSRKQPLEIYGKNIAAILEEQSSMIQQWAIRDHEDQKLWSERIGQTTQKAYNLSHDPRDPNSPWKMSINERAAPVISQDKIGQMDKDLQFIWISGNPVILAERLAYYQIEPWRSQAQKSPYHPDGYPKNKPVRYKL